jgi:S-adenosylmethionine-diacylgycerolhomoserine-N-methlytransferase
MNILRDAPVLWQLAKGVRPEGSHSERLGRFYAPQARRYDAFRERLLQGRQALVERLAVPAGGHVIELGAGTGRNVAFFGERANQFASIELVDVCAPLLDIARARFATHGNVRLIEASAETYQPAQPVDCVYFCYSLSMMLDWAGAVRNAMRMLKPGGHIGVVDFYLPGGKDRLPQFRETFWRRWFLRDGVCLSDQVLPYLQWQSSTLYVSEGRARLPYLPAAHAPYFMFVGQSKE